MSDCAPNGTFIEVGHYQLRKSGQGAAGDTFLSQKHEGDGRIITALSDGLGSGIKAGVLSTLTATMAMKFVAADIPIRRAAKIIMDTLPVCKERGISYATFTLVDVAQDSRVRIMEYDNPGYVLVRKGTSIEPIKQCTSIERKNIKTAPSIDSALYYSDFTGLPGDRLVFFSDGVTQAGMGSRLSPFGWGLENVQDFILGAIAEEPEISARELAREVVVQAQQRDAFKPMDDITCGVIYFRHPRDLLILSGPPVNPEHDGEMAHDFMAFPGRKIACGGTTANILSRELGKPIKIDLRNLDPAVPPTSSMDGVDLVTEGIITLGRVSEILALSERMDRPSAGQGGSYAEGERENGATKIVDLMLDSDRITFVVGTKINEAHQDPNMPVELEIRRNVVKRIQALLMGQYLKDVTIRYI